MYIISKTKEVVKMVQEYLFTSVNNKELKDKFESKEIKFEIVKIKGTNNRWILKCSSSNDNSDIAKELSEIHSKIMLSNPIPIVITNGLSDFLCGRLYPMFNRFERQLRKLLYLSNKIAEKDKKNDNIKNLEEMDLSNLFGLLFYDKKYMNQTKNRIENLSWYNKGDLIKLLDSFTENLLWDNLIGENAVPTLRKRYKELQRYRNDVMHFHNIDYNTFDIANNLLKDINAELGKEISTIIKSDDNLNTSIFDVDMLSNTIKEYKSAFDSVRMIDFSALAKSAVEAAKIPTFDFSPIAKTAIEAAKMPAFDIAKLANPIINTHKESTATKEISETLSPDIPANSTAVKKTESDNDYDNGMKNV